MQVVIALACCILAVVAEPPVEATGEGFSPAQLEGGDNPSAQYGAPQAQQFAGGAAGGPGRHGPGRHGVGHRRGGSPSSQYGVPFNGYGGEGNVSLTVKSVESTLDGNSFRFPTVCRKKGLSTAL